MVDLVSEMGLEKRPPGPFNSKLTLVGPQNKVVFQQWSFLQPLQLFYRYGLFAMLKLHFYINNLLDHFSNIYTFLEEGRSVTSLPAMFQIMSPVSRKNRGNDVPMSDLSQISLLDELRKQNFPENLIQELVTAAVRCNYGQVPSTVHGLVGSVALAGAEGELWSILGGNHLLAEKLLESSKATIVKAEVSIESFILL